MVFPALVVKILSFGHVHVISAGRGGSFLLYFPGDQFAIKSLYTCNIKTLLTSINHGLGDSPLTHDKFPWRFERGLRPDQFVGFSRDSLGGDGGEGE